MASHPQGEVAEETLLHQQVLVAPAALAAEVLIPLLITLVARRPHPGKVMRVATEKTGHLLEPVEAVVAQVLPVVVGFLEIPIKTAVRDCKPR
jgi:hypothetical protein